MVVSADAVVGDSTVYLRDVHVSTLPEIYASATVCTPSPRVYPWISVWARELKFPPLAKRGSQ